MTADKKPQSDDGLIERIAKKHFNVATLETRHSDGLDFYDVAVWNIKAALDEAYAAGKKGLPLQPAAKPAEKPASSASPTSQELSAHVQKLMTEYAFGPEDQASSPDALTMARANMLAHLLAIEMPKLVAQGKNPCLMDWPEILPDFDIHNWYPSMPDDE